MKSKNGYFFHLRALETGHRPTIIIDTLKIAVDGAKEIKNGTDLKETVEKS